MCNVNVQRFGMKEYSVILNHYILLYYYKYVLIVCVKSYGITCRDYNKLKM